MKFKTSAKETMLLDLDIIAEASEHIQLSINHRIEVPETAKIGMINSIAKARLHLGEIENVINGEDSYE